MEAIIIIVNSFRMLESIYPLAALVKKLPADIKTHIISADQDFFDSNGLEASLEAIRAEIYAGEKMIYHLYLIDIGPLDFSVEKLTKFSEDYSPKIVGWLGRGFSDQTISEINFFGKFLIPVTDKSLVSGIEDLGFDIPFYIVQANELITSGHEKQIIDNWAVSRIYKAFQVASVISRNTGDDKCLSFLAAAAQEIYKGFNHPLITSLAAQWVEMNSITRTALRNLDDQAEEFAEARQMGRPVGYAKLGPVSELTDVNTILAEIVRSYPYLAVISYEINDEQLLAFLSRKFREPKQIKQLQPKNLPLEEILSVLNNLVVYHQDLQFQNYN